ncbi:MAG: 2-oxo acid dehydrogenase subunit E2 [Marinilabiliales bacterium]|nr:MAG: 2-oxo acid dehydrogenase subunit E2 [Marinilabiliales bacterium]
MANIEIVLPSMGEGIIEATITRWLVAEGDQVEEDQPVVEIATDKVDSELPSPVSGVVSKILAAEGASIQIGTPVAIIETETEPGKTDPEDVNREVERIQETSGPNASDSKKLPGRESPLIQKTEPGKEQTNLHRGVVPGKIPHHTNSGKFITPLVRSIAEKENLTLQELDKIPGNVDSGRITRNDLVRYLEKRDSQIPEHDEITSSGKPSGNDPGETFEDKVPEPGQQKSAPLNSEGDRVIGMDRVRKLIAEHMVTSKRVSPHVTSFIDADVTELVLWREAVKQRFFERENQKITFTPVFIEAVARSLRDYPMVNVSVDGSDIIVKKNVNIGMAVALPEGNLVVPVIKNADEKNLIGLVKAVNDLASRARNRQLHPSEISGGTFTITNFGTFGNTTGTPIINQPEVAILGAGVIKKRPVVLETEKGDVIAIRHIMTLSLSYDHRVVDGALGGMFLERVARHLENFDINRDI